MSELQSRAEGLPREQVLASAGSGKTFHITSRIIGLLAHNVPPAEILAATFTRKAAGEILDRVLERMALASLDASAAAELAGKAALPGSNVSMPATPEAWRKVLARTVAELHRINIGTLDSFFMRVARSFAAELELPPGWTIARDTTDARLRADSLDEVLRGDRGAIAEILRDLARGSARRSVHEALLRDAARLTELMAELEPGTDPWVDFEQLAAALAQSATALDSPTTLAAELRAWPAPNRTWQNALERCADLVREGNWSDLLDQRLCEAALADGNFARRPVEAALRLVFEQAAGHARYELAKTYAAQARAHGRFAAALAEALEKKRQETAFYGFSDVTRRLASEQITANPGLHYRLDARTRHLLLDEFQDTSVAQWQALEPIADELFSGNADDRAGVIVADPKQSIYGWRGATPGLVRKVAARHRLTPVLRTESWRSSAVVLEVVNRVFAGLAEASIWEDDGIGARVAAEWLEDFGRHVAAKDRPGYVTIEVGPDDESRGSERPNLCRAAAELVARMRSDAPGRTIGVLTRTNRTVARIMYELRRLNIDSSEEGGVPLVDAAPVASLLALLRLVDHPSDTIARYHVAKTPLGRVLRYADPGSEHGTARLTRLLRARLADDGYGATLARYARRLAPHCDDRERRRLGQLVELGFRYDAEATLRTRDFVELVEAERVEDPTAARVRVMTVHQAKGLEFDIVVLPELDVGISAGHTAVLPLREEGGTGRVVKVYPYVRQSQQAMFTDMLPDLAEALRQHHAAALRDALSALYVALTRARHAVHILVRPDGENGVRTAKTLARIVRDALVPGEVAREGEALFAYGQSDWHRMPESSGEVTKAALPSTHGSSASPAIGEIRLRRDTARRRVLPRRSPSELEGGVKIDFTREFRVDGGASARRGTIAHAWFEAIAWLDEHTPSQDELRSIVRRIAPGLPEVELQALLGEFAAWCRAEAVRGALCRAHYDGEVTLERELRFLLRDADGLLEGVIDRLVLTERDGRIVAAEILDFKTDILAADDETLLAQRVDHYRPQIEAYRRAVGSLYGLPAHDVRGTLIFVHAGVVRKV